MASEPFEYAGQVSALEKFASNNPDLEELERLAREFDALRFLGLSRVENTHSDILAWLLNPRENHGAGDYFLKDFLAETGGATRQEIQSYDWSGTTVRREWPNEVDGEMGLLDILILNQRENFVCAIENKIDSQEHTRQLTRYRKALEVRYPRLRRSHLFLSPGGTRPGRADDRDWIPVDYGKVLNSVEATLREGMDRENHAAAAFLRQYATTLRRNIVPDTTVETLATRIYLQHREAIDLIIRNREAYVQDLKQFCREAIPEQSGWGIPDSPQEKMVGFFHNDWNDFDSFRAGKGWGDESKAALRFHFDLRNVGTVNLILTIPEGSSEDVTRRALFDMAHRQPHIFDHKGSRYGGRYTASWIRLHVSEPILSEEDFVNWDREAARQKILHWMGNFAARGFPAMDEAIVACLRGVDENHG